MAGLPDERLGEVPVAAEVAPDASSDEETNRHELRSRLAPYELPRQVVFVTAISRLNTGKVARPGVAPLVQATPG